MTAPVHARDPHMTARRYRLGLYLLILATLAVHIVGLAAGWTVLPRYSGRVSSIDGSMWVANAAIPVKYFIKTDFPTSQQTVWGRIASGWSCTVIETHTQNTSEFERSNGSITPMLAPNSPMKTLLTSPPSWTVAPYAFTKSNPREVRFTVQEIALGFPWRFVVHRQCYATAPNGQPTVVSLSDRPGDQSAWVVLWWRAAGAFGAVLLGLCSPRVVWLGYKRARAVFWQRSGRCGNCGYPRAGLAVGTGACPECGYSNQKASESRGPAPAAVE